MRPDYDTLEVTLEDKLLSVAMNERVFHQVHSVNAPFHGHDWRIQIRRGSSAA